MHDFQSVQSQIVKKKYDNVSAATISEQMIALCRPIYRITAGGALSLSTAPLRDNVTGRRCVARQVNGWMDKKYFVILPHARQ